jgi:hypothetical protein
MTLKIWSFWHDTDNIPKLVTKCVNSWKVQAPGWKICFLNLETVHNYIDINVNIYKSYKTAVLADIIRLKLLSKYGGLWIDASVLLHKPLTHIIHDMDRMFYFRLHGHEHVECWFMYFPVKYCFIADIWVKSMQSVIQTPNFVETHPVYTDSKHCISERKTYFILYQCWCYLNNTNTDFRHAFEQSIIVDVRSDIFNSFFIYCKNPLTKYISSTRKWYPYMLPAWVTIFLICVSVYIALVVVCCKSCNR